MIDINTPILKAYYNAIDALGIPVYEGEEPDDVLDKIYVVISDVSSNDVSTKVLLILTVIFSFQFIHGSINMLTVQHLTQRLGRFYRQLSRMLTVYLI